VPGRKITPLPQRACHHAIGTTRKLSLEKRAKSAPVELATNRGFSLVELVVSVAVLLVLAALAMPVLTRAFAAYQLNDAATRLAGILKFTRYEAIRLNKLVDCEFQQSGANWVVYADVNRNHQLDPGETEDAITGQNTLLPAGGGIPGPGPIATALGSSGMTLTSISGTNAVITFDARGSVTSGNSNVVYIWYLGNAVGSDAGYRAIVLLPSGMVHVWTAPGGGVWQQVS
jgi:type IV fimbrial biogenesis protein FimT